EEPVGVAVPETSKLAKTANVTARDLADWPLVCWGACHATEVLLEKMAKDGLQPQTLHRVSSSADLALVADALGAYPLGPVSTRLPGRTMKLVTDAPLKHRVNLVAVAGRPYSKAAGVLIRLVRALDWSRLTKTV
ncbi:MAG TPA: LysR substrate-binding domain-containing protein, partial [Sphingomonadales bacterium]|nr:LysR substrate-binding domain-containing protein [Sphingomonadales bacterium]